MDTIALSGSALLMKADQTKLTISMAIMKRAAAQQSQMADMLAQSARQAAQAAGGNGSNYNFSTYA